MHSSRMHTACSSSHLLGVRGCVCLIACWDTPLQVWAWRPPTPRVWTWIPPRCGPGDPPSQTPQPLPWAWAWRPPWLDPSTSPLGVGLEIPTSKTPQPPPWVWAWRFPQPDPSTFPLGVGLETPPGQTPQPPPGCGPGDPPRAESQTRVKT